MQQEQLPFDPNVYYGIVADNLLKNLGPKALHYADHALAKMKSLGDEKGLDIWLNIHEHLIMRSMPEHHADTAMIH
ncbi:MULTISPECIES: hypothetical protein [Kordiimonas]|uniref:hypothetical protein n=1 Tax=Kordiimonas TaxID=288021 RepID=UPI001FF62DC4|nr:MULTISPECIES: hypothetical protein [Kordiimonas]MCK0069216.1 hypothetical protein [Kordiimonas laminariae]UTW58550.1 hypothetical protein KFE96_17290 [Kordiimonas sp. SCSIO 12603]